MNLFTNQVNPFKDIGIYIYLNFKITEIFFSKDMEISGSYFYVIYLYLGFSCGITCVEFYSSQEYLKAADVLL